MVLTTTRSLWPAALALTALLLAACGGESGDDGNVATNGTPGYIPPLVATTLAEGTATPVPIDPNAPTSTPRADDDDFTTGPIDIIPADVPPEAQAAVDAVIAEVLRRLIEVEEEDITVLGVEAREWSDSCLDVVYTNQQEPCAQVITPGYNVTVHFGDTVSTWHTNDDGSVVRFASQQIVESE